VTFAARTNTRAGAQRGACGGARVMQAWTFLGNKDVLSIVELYTGLGF